MKQYITLVVLIGVVSVLSFLSGVLYEQSVAAELRKRMAQELHFGHALTSAGEKFRVLQDLEDGNTDRAKSRLSKLMDLDLLAASLHRVPELQHLDALGNTDWVALRDLRNKLQLGHTKPHENTVINAELERLITTPIQSMHAPQ
jgi:hypothetical protein